MNNLYKVIYLSEVNEHNVHVLSSDADSALTDFNNWAREEYRKYEKIEVLSVILVNKDIIVEGKK